MSLQTQSNMRFLYLDSVRAVAAVYVLLHHASLQYNGISKSNLTGIKDYIIKIFSYGHLSVDLFIVLSGFSLMLAVIKNDYQLKGGSLLFFKRRIKRIIPPYYAVVFICLLLGWFFIGNKTDTYWDGTLPVTYNDIVSHLLMVHDFFSSSSTRINYSLWSISVEFRIYLLFPLLIWIWRKKGIFAALSFSVAFAVTGAFLLLYIKNYYPDISLETSGVSPFIVLFMLGMLAADISFSQSIMASTIRKFYSGLSKKALIIAVVIYIGAYLGTSILFKTGNTITDTQFFISQEIKDVLIGIFSAFFLFFCAVSNQPNNQISWIVRFLNWQPLVFIGSFSYSLYLIHPPLLQILSQYVLEPFHLRLFTNTCLLLVFGAPIIVFISYLFFLLFERPFLNSGKRTNILATEINAVHNPAP